MAKNCSTWVLTSLVYFTGGPRLLTSCMYADHAPWVHYARLQEKPKECPRRKLLILFVWFFKLTDCWLTDPPSIDWLTDQLPEWQIDWLTVKLTDWLIDQANGQPTLPTNWLTDLCTELTHYFVVYRDVSLLWFFGHQLTRDPWLI